jgi:LPS-assembly protein
MGRKMQRFLAIAVWIFAVATPILHAADAPKPINVTADKYEFDREANLVIGEGNVVAELDGTVLRADRVRLNTQTREAWAEGNVRLWQGAQQWLGERLYYNFITREVQADAFTAFDFPWYVWSTSVEGITTNQLRLGSSYLTTCDYEKPHYRFAASRVEVYPNNRVVARNVRLLIGNVPVFWIPVFVQQQKDEQFALTMDVGQSSQWGAFALLAYRYALTENLTTTLRTDYRTRRGPGGGLDVDYRTSTTISLWEGYYLNDKRPVDAEDVGKKITEDRYRLKWKHRQDFPERTTVMLSLAKWSDPDIEEDFFRGDFARENQPDNYISAAKRGDAFVISVLARPQVNPFFETVERLPDVKLETPRVKIGPTPLYYEGETSVAHLRQNFVGAASTNDAHVVRLDTFHQIVWPNMLFGWLSVTPRVGGRESWYSRAPSEPDLGELRRHVFNTGVEASFKASRTWRDVRSERFDVDGLRHIIEPSVNYAWVPRPNKEPSDLFQMDTARFTSNGIPVTRFLPIDFPQFNRIDDIDAMHVARIRLRNRLQTQREHLPHDLIDWIVWTDYRIERDAGQSQFSDLFSTLEIRPVRWFALDTFTRYDINGRELREANADFRVLHDDWWSVGVGTRYVKDDSHQISADWYQRINRGWWFRVYQRFRFDDGAFEEVSGTIGQELHDWIIGYTLRYRNEMLRSDEIQGIVTVTLRAFPGRGVRVHY